MRISSKKILVGDIVRVSDPIPGETDPWTIQLLVIGEFILPKLDPNSPPVRGFTFLTLSSLRTIHYSKRDLDLLVVELVARPDAK